MRFFAIVAAVLSCCLYSCNDLSEDDEVLLMLDKDIINFSANGGRDSVWTTNQRGLWIDVGIKSTADGEEQYFYPQSSRTSTEVLTDSVWGSRDSYVLDAEWVYCAVPVANATTMRIAVAPNTDPMGRSLAVRLSYGGKSCMFIINQVGKGQSL